MLSDRDIRQRLVCGDLQISPLEDPARQIQPASVDLRLGERLTTYAPLSTYDPRAKRGLVTHTHTLGSEGFVLHPGSFVLGATRERLRLPRDLAARVEGRSSWGRLGVLVHATAGFIDPGFEGQITLEISNVGTFGCRLRPGDLISQVVFERLDSPCLVAYGEHTTSKYQGQQGPTPSRVGGDYEDDEESR